MKKIYLLLLALLVAFGSKALEIAFSNTEGWSGDIYANIIFRSANGNPFTRKDREQKMTASTETGLYHATLDGTPPTETLFISGLQFYCRSYSSVKVDYNGEGVYDKYGKIGNEPTQTQYSNITPLKSRKRAYDINGDGNIEFLDEGYRVTTWNFVRPQLHFSSIAFDDVIRPSDGRFSQLLDFNNDGYVDAIYDGKLYLGDKDGMFNEHISFSKDNGMTAVDVTNDGRLDLLELVTKKKIGRIIHHLDGDGELMAHINVEPLNEYTKRGGGLPSVSEGMFVGGAGPAPFSSFVSADFNGDGIPDLVSADAGRLYMGQGDGSLVEIECGGGMKIRDLNGDGLQDYIMFDSGSKTLSVGFLQSDGSQKVSTLLSGLNCSSNIWAYDFDKDGDVDILVPFDFVVGNKNNGASYLVMFENNGKGSFKKHENFIEGEFYFYDCVDIDADGCFEVMGADYAKDTDTRNSYFKIDGLKVNTTPVNLPPANEPIKVYADLTNSGRVLYPSASGWIALSDKINQRPTPPTKAPDLSYDPSTERLQVSWERGSDAESSAIDLTYELRVSTTPGAGDIVPADALADGTRRNLLDGRQGYSTLRTLNVADWPAGKYYIDVQAIDPNHRGSKFSTAAVWEKKHHSASFDIEFARPFAKGDTCRIVTKAPASGLHYSWELDGATIIGENAARNILSVKYDNAGDKLIKLSLLDKQNTVLASTEQSFAVSDFGFEPRGGIEKLEPYVSADFDADGRAEIFASYRIYKQDDNGVWDSAKYIYNTSMPESSSVRPVDINRDGFADLLFNSRNVSYISLGNLDMEKYSQPTESNDYGFYDFDNDGYPEVIAYTGYPFRIRSYKQTSGNDNLLTLGAELTTKSNCMDGIIQDFDGDGLADLCVDRSNDQKPRRPALYSMINSGKNTFSMGEPLLDITDDNASEILESFRAKLYRDFDGDGKLDLFGYKYDSTSKEFSFYIVWNDGQISPLPFTNIYNFFEGYDRPVFDIDNNGYPDIFLELNDRAKGNTEESVIIHMGPGRTFTIESLYRGNADYEISSIEPNVLFNDIDGYPIIYDSHNYRSVALRMKNTPPSAPDKVTVTETEKGVRIDWSQGRDAETIAPYIRYNISVKRKGAEGPQAYFISPMNDEVDFAPVAMPRTYLTSTRMLIPEIEEGEYTVRIQSIDALNATSAFSAPVEFTVRKKFFGDVPSAVPVGSPATITVAQNNADIDWCGGSVVSADGNTYRVSWSAPGIVTLRSGGATAQINVIERTDDFDIPSPVYVGDKVEFTGSRLNEGIWEISDDGGQTFAKVSSESGAMPEFWSLEAQRGIFAPLTEGRRILRHTLKDECGEAHYTRTVEVSAPLPGAIRYVARPAASGGLAIHLNQAPEGASGIRIYKEGPDEGVYVPLGDVSREETVFIDRSADPTRRAYRYTASYIWAYGESAQAEPHRSLHAHINRGKDSKINLMWSRYEGAPVESYVIMRGPSADKLTRLASVSGTCASFTDDSPSAAEPYYAVEFSLSPDSRSTAEAVRSNVLSAADAQDAILITDVEITSDEPYMSFDSPDRRFIQLNAIITPAHASFRKVNWEIVAGEGLATVNENGRVTPLPGAPAGMVIVRASAVDGSACYDEISINKTTGTEDILANGMEKRALTCGPSPADNSVTIKGLPDDGALIYVFNTAGATVRIIKAESSEITIQVADLAAGHYFVRAYGASDVQHTRFIKR